MVAVPFIIRSVMPVAATLGGDWATRPVTVWPFRPNFFYSDGGGVELDGWEGVLAGTFIRMGGFRTLALVMNEVVVATTAGIARR